MACRASRRKNGTLSAFNIFTSIGERIISAGKTAFDYDDGPLLIKPFTDRKIVQIASGQQHSLALSDDGYVWAWGRFIGSSSESRGTD
jgi:hypothetical protein